MEEIIKDLEKAIAEINQGITLARNTVDNQFDQYLNKEAMLNDARAKVQKAIQDLQAIQL